MSGWDIFRQYAKIATFRYCKGAQFSPIRSRPENFMDLDGNLLLLLMFQVKEFGSPEFADHFSGHTFMRVGVPKLACLLVYEEKKN